MRGSCTQGRGTRTEIMVKKKFTTKTGSPAVEINSVTIEEKQTFWERLGRALRTGDVVALRGELGSGKTTLIQGIARGLGLNPDMVKSPTFVLMREYPGHVPLIHVDGYRLEGAPSAMWLDPDLLFSSTKITVIEWAERFEGVLPESCLEIQLTHVSTNRRRLRVSGGGARAGAVLKALGEDAASTAAAGSADQVKKPEQEESAR